MKALVALALLAAFGVASAQSAYRRAGLFDYFSETFNRPSSLTTQADGAGFGVNGGSAPYRVYPFRVSASGTYVAEMYSPSGVAPMLFVYADGFDAKRPLLNLLNGDGGASTTEAFTVLSPLANVPGSQRARVSTNPGTGNFVDGAGLRLDAGRDYYFVASSYYSLFGGGASQGGYDFGIGGGPGDVTPFQPVPEPATLATLALGGLALLRRRRRSA